ncbi:MAG: uridine kinase [Nanoarchaeota archaeon]|nr:uridine kinase [Nanoarchaeota archaeon]
MKEPMLVALAGASCSGKTTIAKKIAERIEDMNRYLSANFTGLTIKMDNYYNDQKHIPPEKRPEINYDHPNAFDWLLMYNQIRALSQNKEIEMPLYCFDNHTRKEETETKSPSDLIIVEGILTLYNEKIYDLVDCKIFIETDINKCRDRRLERDTNERGRTRESVVKQWEKTVLPGYEKYILPSRDIADLIIRGEGNNEEDIKRAMVKIKYFLINNQQDL